MRKVPKTKFLAFALCAAMVLVFWQGKAGLAWSESECILKLPDKCTHPPSPAQVKDLFTNELEACADILDPSNRSYFETTIDVPDDGFSIVDGTYDGWCLDLEGEVRQNDDFGVNLISSLDAPTIPEITRDISETEWNQINCILNDETVERNWLDEQAAYWTIIEGSFPDNFPFGDNIPDGCDPPNKPDQDVVDDLVDLAGTGFCKSFKPTAGQKVAVVVQPLLPETCDPDPAKQLNIIEAECCKFITKRVSVDGGYTFLNADDCDDAPSVDGPKDVLYEICVTNCGDTPLDKVFIDDPDIGVKWIAGPLGENEKECFYPDPIDSFPCADDDDASSSVNKATAVGFFDPDPDDMDDSSSTIMDMDTACVLCDDDD